MLFLLCIFLENIQSCSAKYVVKLDEKDRSVESKNPDGTEVYQEASTYHLKPVETVTIFASPGLVKKHDMYIPSPVSKLFNSLFSSTASSKDGDDKYVFMKGDIAKHIKDDPDEGADEQGDKNADTNPPQQEDEEKEKPAEEAE
ncbi:hypothetical protein EQH57_0311 [Dictyocoela roeselum]|nr:hypothetical protein EQH57_0311 [Dictyocoela roeselum]